MPQSIIAPAHEYQVACICALQTELDAITAMLDEEHEGRPPLSELSQNAYTFGRIGEHRIVITTTTRCGNNLAAAVATQLVNDFPRIKFCFLVGIGGGVPDKRRNIRLGDVVVSTPNSQSTGVVQYDLGKLFPDGRFERSPRSNEPPRILTGYSSRLRARGEQKLWMQMLDYLKDIN